MAAADDPEAFASLVFDLLTGSERPCWPGEMRLKPDLPAEVLRAVPGAWEAFLATHLGRLIEIGRGRGLDRRLRERAAALEEEDGLFRADADLAAWVEVVWPTYCIGPDLYRLRYGMLPWEVFQEEMAMEEKRSRESELNAQIERLQIGRPEEGEGFLYWFVDEGTAEEFGRLLEAERKVQTGVWPDWSGPEDLEEWWERQPEDWTEGIDDRGLESAQREAGFMSRARCRTILAAAERRGMADLVTKYGTSGKLISKGEL